MLVIVTEDYEEMSKEAARRVAALIRKKPNCVLGLATGGTPLGLYRELIRMHREEGLDFSKVTTFNLDEYVGLPPEHPQSYHHFMWENFFRHINIDRRYVYIPHGMADDIEEHCRWYEEMIQKAGGIDLQILGIGANGHIAFNEPGSSLGSRTRIKTLTEQTRRDNARFFGSIDQVPKYAITMGIGTIMEARQILLLASGKSKAHAIKITVEGPITAMVPATIVQMHPKATIIVDKEAASELTGSYTG
ncbi:MAG: glucosamine-6-phosphate deaminase [candidate division KSB1 bacterium]|nr:glucosamine-6-phosphate deaminase [candidate division KSB1 bacterium]